jgi:hypothetical protein
MAVRSRYLLKNQAKLHNIPDKTPYIWVKYFYREYKH